MLKKLPWGNDYVDPNTIVSVEVFDHGPDHDRPFVRLRVAKSGAGFEMKSKAAGLLMEAERWADEIAAWQTDAPYR